MGATLIIEYCQTQIQTRGNFRHDADNWQITGIWQKWLAACSSAANP